MGTPVVSAGGIGGGDSPDLGIAPPFSFLGTQGPTDPTKGSLVVVMVGLPARCKTFVARKLANYMRWCGIPSRVFNVGDYRRQVVPDSHYPEFFCSKHRSNASLRERLAMEVLTSALEWLAAEQPRMCVFDATNTTVERRAWVMDLIAEMAPRHCRTLVVESRMDLPELVEANVREKLQFGRDWEHVPPDTALRQMMERIREYEAVYQPAEQDMVYNRVTLHNLRHYSTSSDLDEEQRGAPHRSTRARALKFVTSIHNGYRPIVLVALLPGESDPSQHLLADALTFCNQHAAGNSTSGQSPPSRRAGSGSGSTALLQVAMMRFDAFGRESEGPDARDGLDSALLAMEACQQPVVFVAPVEVQQQLLVYFCVDLSMAWEQQALAVIPVHTEGACRWRTVSLSLV